MRLSSVFSKKTLWSYTQGRIFLPDLKERGFQSVNFDECFTRDAGFITVESEMDAYFDELKDVEEYL